MKKIFILIPLAALLYGCAFDLPSERNPCKGQPVQAAENFEFTGGGDRSYDYCGTAIAHYNQGSENVLQLNTSIFSRSDEMGSNSGSVGITLTSAQEITQADVLNNPNIEWKVNLFLGGHAMSNLTAEELFVTINDNHVTASVALTFNNFDAETQQTSVNRITVNFNNIEIED